jgi:hypothetical protein
MIQTENILSCIYVLSVYFCSSGSFVFCVYLTTYTLRLSMWKIEQGCQQPLECHKYVTSKSFITIKAFKTNIIVAISEKVRKQLEVSKDQATVSTKTRKGKHLKNK